LKKRGKKVLVFAQSLSYNKRSAVPVPDSFIKESVLKYSKTLSQDIDPVNINVDLIDYTIKSVFKKKITFENYISKTNYSISNHASSEGLQYETYSDIAPKVNLKGVLDQQYNGPCPSPFFSSSYIPTNLEGKLTSILEPLKVRNITTTHAFELVAGKPLQLCQTRQLVRYKNMIYGREVKESDIHRLYKRSVRYWTQRGFKKEDLYWLSGDYESATDNIHPKISNLIDQRMFDLGINPNFPLLQELIIDQTWSAMAKTYEILPINGPSCQKLNWIRVNIWFLYASKSYHKGDFLTKRNQTWCNRNIYDSTKEKKFICNQKYGQMMGDIKSFPILCLLNLILWYSICYDFNNKYTESPCLINGDDFCTFCPMIIIKDWFKKAKDFSLIPTVGKSFISKGLVQINSRLFYYNNQEESMCSVELIPISLLFKQREDIPVVESMNLLLNNGGNYKRLLLYNKKILKIISRSSLINYSIPTYLGGLGLNMPLNKGKITLLQGGVIYENERRLKQNLSSRIQPIWSVIPYSKKKVFNHSLKRKINKFDQVEFDFMPTYKSSNKSRSIAKDAWISSMSTKYARNTYMKIENKFYRQFLKIKPHKIKLNHKFRGNVIKPIHPTSYNNNNYEEKYSLVINNELDSYKVIKVKKEFRVFRPEIKFPELLPINRLGLSKFDYKNAYFLCLDVFSVPF
jgi:hypothetical protein